MSLRQHGSEPRRETAASVEVTKERSFEQFAINAVGQFPRSSSGVERIRRAVERRPMFPDEVFPGCFVAGRAGARQREVFETEVVEVCAAFGAAFERLGKPRDRHMPALSACPAIQALGERDVDRQASHSTPSALIGDDAQQHADRKRKQRPR